jgi:hypothetical protein
VDQPLEISGEQRRLGELGPRMVRGAGVVGLVGLGAAVLQAALTENGLERFFHAYLVNFCYFLSLALGALFFVMLQHVTRSGWSVVLRRLAEGMAATLPVLAVLVIPVLIGMHDLYHWTHADALAEDPLLRWKRPYLNPPFFIIRVVVYFVVWAVLARFFLTTSARQDRTGDVRLTLRMQAVSAPGLVLFAVTVTFAAFDLIMSLDPHWYSTIFGVYYFSGSVVGFFALLALVVYLVQRSGRLAHAITIEHYHDLGKLIFAFIVFWAYIAFSQYLLIWYANIPEETRWYQYRQSGGWVAVSIALLFGHFVVPFLALISRHAKRRKGLLAAAAVWILLVHWLDVYQLVMPDADPLHVVPSFMALTCFIGIGGLCVAAAVFTLQKHALLPERDPRLRESMSFENV